jgi:hypothetical protein
MHSVSMRSLCDSGCCACNIYLTQLAQDFGGWGWAMGPITPVERDIRCPQAVGNRGLRGRTIHFGPWSMALVNGPGQYFLGQDKHVVTCSVYVTAAYEQQRAIPWQ